MKTRLLISLALMLMLIPLQSFAEEIKIKIGESVSYEDLNLTVYDVEDSRCPLDVACVWEGKVSARIQTSNQTHKMGAPLEIGSPFTYITPYAITLVDIKPHPISTEKPDYVAILEITKLPEPEKSNPSTLSYEQEQMMREYCETGMRHPDMIGIPQCLKHELVCGPNSKLVDDVCVVIDGGCEPDIDGNTTWCGPQYDYWEIIFSEPFAFLFVFGTLGLIVGIPLVLIYYFKIKRK